MKLKIFILSIFIVFTLAVTGCDNEGPAEKTGEKIDETVEDVGDAVEDAVEDAGDEIQDATQN